MKRILMIGVLVGLAMIVFLSGTLIYQVHRVKEQTQSTLNQRLKDYASVLEGKSISLHFSPFECRGFFGIECKTPRIIFFTENSLLLSLSDAFLSLRDLSTKSLTSDFGFNVDDIQKSQGLENYFEALMPSKIKGSVKFTLQQEDIASQSNVDLVAKNMNYNIRLDSKMRADKLQEKGLLKDPLGNLLGEPVMLEKIDFQFIAKDLDFALLEVFKKQYGSEITLQDYRGFLAFMIALAREQFSSSTTIRQVIDGAGQLASGEKKELLLRLLAKEEICLNCELSFEGLNRVIEQSDIAVLVE